MPKYPYGNYYWVTYDGRRFIACAIGEAYEGGTQQFQEVSTNTVYLVTYCSDIVEIIDV